MAQRRLDGIARKRPDLLAKIAAGELTVRKAARQAGVEKPPDPFDELVRWWGRADEGRRSRFMDFIGAQLKGDAA